MKLLRNSNVPKASEKIVVTEKSVVKYFNVEFELDKIVNKHENMANVLKANHVVTPEIISVSEQQHSIEFTKLNLTDHLGKQTQNSINRSPPLETLLALYESIGKTLGVIHRDLTLPSKTESMSTGLLNDIAYETNDDNGAQEIWKVFVHGDFSLNNLFFVDNKIAVIDPVPNQTTMFHMDEYGSNTIEVSFFCNSVLRQLSYKHYSKANIELVSRLVDNFLQSYEKVTDRKVCRSKLRKLVKATDSCIAKKQLRSKAIRSARAMALRSLASRTIR